MPMVRKRDSIYFQLFQLLILAALVSGLFFLVTNWAGDSLLNWFYISSNYEEKKNGEYIGRLQEYVSQNQLSTEDTKELTEWVRRQRVVALQLYKNGILVYGDAREEGPYNIQNLRFENVNLRLTRQTDWPKDIHDLRPFWDTPMVKGPMAAVYARYAQGLRFNGLSYIIEEEMKEYVK